MHDEKLKLKTKYWSSILCCSFCQYDSVRGSWRKTEIRTCV